METKFKPFKDADVTEFSSLNAIIKESVIKNWDLMAFSDMGGMNYRYKDVAEYVEKLRILFDAAGLKRGDKVAICGKNSSNWAVTFIACISSGLVAVPLLHEFKPDVLHHLINHCGAKMLFVDETIWKTLSIDELPALETVIFISEFGMPVCRRDAVCDARNNLNVLFGQKYPYSFDPKHFTVVDDQPDELCIINYTSGSTGLSKGVMLPYRSIWSNIRFCIDNISYLNPGDGVVNMLPLAHLYGMVIDMLHPFCKGLHCHFLTRLPSPQIIMKAFAEVRPKLIITVPLILEKIVRAKIFPMLERPMMRLLTKVPLIDDKLYARVRQGMIDVFGSDVRQVIIGGAPLNKDVAKFLKRIDFPVTVGYGMTECGPLITYAPADEAKPGACGRIVSRMEMKVDSLDQQHIPGNLWVRGMNVMLGYYNNDEATRDVMMGDGWMNTGDMCTIDEDGYLTISGRSKTMILGPSGQNIYPEEIEQKLNNLPYVLESLVIERDGRLTGLVVPDKDLVEQEKISADKLDEIMKDNLNALNQEMPSYSKVYQLQLMDEEFEKTPKRSIKRYLYQSHN